MRKLTDDQEDCLRRADERGRVTSHGRGSKGRLLGLEKRGLVTDIRIPIYGGYGSGYEATLTEFGERVAKTLGAEF